ncbi:MAG: NfeD family protein [Solirubrobacteraceae bacterium]
MTEAGILLLVVGAVVAVAEAHYPTHGIAGGVGLVAMAVGAVLAVSGLGAGVLLGLLVGGGLLAAGGGLLAMSVSRGAAARRLRVMTGAEGIVGHVGIVRSWADASGSVALDGSLWRARRSAIQEEDLHAGDQVVVERLTGLTLCVRRAEEWELP